MYIEHHDLDPYPIPKEKSPLYINEPWLVDGSIIRDLGDNKEPEPQEDNIRVYVPLDLNRKAILRRLDDIIMRYDEANEENESDFMFEVERLISQIEIYDQVWFVRHMPEDRKHSAEAKLLVKDFIAALEEIPDGCAETFPFELIQDLRREYFPD